MKRVCFLFLTVVLLIIGPFTTAGLAEPRQSNVQKDVGSQSAPQTPPTSPADYILGPFDQIAVVVGQFSDEFTDKTFRIDGNGDVSLPLAGRLHAGGLSPHELEDKIKERLGSILKNPDVVVNVTEFSSQTFSVLGAVTASGVHRLLGATTLFDALSYSQGFEEGSGTTVRITREAKWGVLPLPGATVDSKAHVSTAVVRIRDISHASTENIIVMPGDVLFVPKADVVYAVGSVTKPGGFPIGEKETLSALQVVSLAQGLQKTAASDKAKILRVVPGSPSREEIPVNIKLLMAGKTADIALKPEDILFIPNSGAKTASARTVDAIVNAASGLAVLGARY